MKSMTEEEKRALIEAKLKSMTPEEKKALIDAKKKNVTIYLSFSSDVVTKGVFVDFKNYDLALSDNFFDLYSSEPYTVSVKTDLTEEEILSELQITNLYDAQ